MIFRYPSQDSSFVVQLVFAPLAFADIGEQFNVLKPPVFLNHRVWPEIDLGTRIYAPLCLVEHVYVAEMVFVIVPEMWMMSTRATPLALSALAE